jgi:hypothetical protein
MPGWLVALVIVLGLFAVRGLTFTYLYVRAGQLRALLDRYWRDEVTYPQVAGRKREIVGLFSAARVKAPGYDKFTPTPGGWMHRTLGVFDNIFVKERGVPHFVSDSFLEARGYFVDEIRRSFIPIYWPSVIINTPADLLVYIGVSPETAVVRVAKVMTGLAAFAAAIVAILKVVS